MLRDMFVQAARERRTGAEDKARAAAMAYVQSNNSGDIDARLSLFAPDATFEDPVGTPPMRGHDALRAFWGQGAALDLSMNLEHVAANANCAAMVFIASLAMEGAGQVQLRVIETIETDDQGLITRMRSYFDEGSIS
jgi:steroid delta-isomerase